jgi:hypothetical protein
MTAAGLFHKVPTTAKMESLCEALMQKENEGAMPNAGQSTRPLTCFCYGRSIGSSSGTHEYFRHVRNRLPLSRLGVGQSRPPVGRGQPVTQGPLPALVVSRSRRKATCRPAGHHMPRCAFGGWSGSSFKSSLRHLARCRARSLVAPRFGNRPLQPRRGTGRTLRRQRRAGAHP